MSYFVTNLSIEFSALNVFLQPLPTLMHVLSGNIIRLVIVLFLGVFRISVVLYFVAGSMDVAAVTASIILLAAYALINFSTFHISLIQPIGWRPTFKVRVKTRPF